MIGTPPVKLGGLHASMTDALRATAETAVGESGTVAGVTELLAADAGPIPTAFVAVTVKVYGVPFVRPVTVIGLPVEVAENPPEFAIAV
jgi:hypothetical protein